jgi:hypothetical protein
MIEKLNLIVNRVSENLKNNIGVVFASLFVVQSILAIRFGLKVPWGGDEWFSYNNFTVMAYPFSVLASVIKGLAGEVNAQNFIIYRQQGLLWSLLVYLFLYKVHTRSKNIYLSDLALFLTIFISLAPYFLETSQFFRYYQLYISVSIVITFCIIKYDEIYTQKRIWFFLLLFSSLFIHLFIFIQLSVYIALKELFRLSNKAIIKIIIISIVGLMVIIPNLANILTWSYHSLFPMYAYDFPEIHRGYSLSTILKPFIIIYTFMFSREIHPFSHLFLDLCYIISGVGIVYGLILIIKSNGILKTPLLFSALSPLIVSILVIEPISLPMMTQIAPQHIIFLFSWLGIIMYQLWIKSAIGKIITFIFFSGLIYANIMQQQLEFVDWNKIQKVVGDEKVPVISDAAKTCEFFLNNSATWFQYTERVENIISTSDTISLTMTNWKNYQIIDSLQFWHNPNGSEQEYQSIKGIIKMLKNNKFSLINGYSFFPIHSYTFARNNEGEWAEPWFYDLKYGDLKLPLLIDDNKIIGFQKIEFGEDTQFDSSCYYFIQTIDPMMEIPAIQITSIDGSMFKYNLDDETDLYRSNFCRSINEDEIVYTYNKSPLVSNSMRYPGSIFNSEGRIYKFTKQGKGFSIMPLNRNVTLFIAILDKEN